MTTLPSPPFITVPGISNFRDIGGTKTSDGKRIRRGLVFRSADPSKATEDGRTKMSEVLGTVRLKRVGPCPVFSTDAKAPAIKVIFDLRSTPEIKRDGPEWAGLEVDKDDAFEPYGIHRLWNPVFADKDYGPESVALRYKDYTSTGPEGFTRAYHDILQAGSTAYNKILKHLAQPSPQPCLINCTAGKDRTGVIIALLLTLAGVTPDDTADEYALTDLGLAEWKPVFVQRLMKNPALENDEPGVSVSRRMLLTIH